MATTDSSAPMAPTSDERLAAIERDLASLLERLDALEARSEHDVSAHERALEHRDQDIARLQEQLRTEAYERDRLERQVSSLKWKGAQP